MKHSEFLYVPTKKPKPTKNHKTKTKKELKQYHKTRKNANANDCQATALRMIANDHLESFATIMHLRPPQKKKASRKEIF